MIKYDLLVDSDPKVSVDKAKTTFFWTKKGSFDSSYGAELGGLGAVLEPNVDFVRIAAAVYAADRSALRSSSGSNWSRREIKVGIPVFDVSRWESVKTELTSLINFLTGDSWSFEFVKTPKINEERADFQKGSKRIVLVSGGADSAVGALVSRAELRNANHILVSHVGQKTIAPIQRNLVKAIEDAIPGVPQTHIQINFRRHTKSNGVTFGNEFSTRSRSLLFLSFGLAIASREGIELWIPENGFASLSLPLGPERRGSLSTRTTQPYFLKTLAGILSKVGAHADFINPFERLTKGEMFTKAAELIGPDKASDLLSMTHSCSATGQRSFKIAVTKQCGVCYSCVIRRASFKVAKLEDKTQYIDGTGNPALQSWLLGKSITRAVQDLTYKGLQTKDIASMKLPSDFSAAEAQKLCERGLQELKEFYS